ncbi:MAG: N-succinylarginine dihydrolase [Pontibacterium sp.]
MRYQELNMDGLVGPTHHYAGLSSGNFASQKHGGQVASPRQAALQGLEKMWLLHNLGIAQAVLPPPLRPRLDLLRQLGFSGTDAWLLSTATKEAPALLSACYSASGMWAANSATVTASVDSPEDKVQFTPANLVFNLHRSLETEHNSRILKRIFSHPQHFIHHSALPASCELGDEGAANFTRLCAAPDLPGISLLTFGQKPGKERPVKYPARHTWEAACAIRRSHQLNRTNSLLVQQHPDSIDQGVFHNDVIAVGHRNLLLIHEQAWLDQPQKLDQLRRLWGERGELFIEQIASRHLSVEQAVSSYLFNSQLVSTEAGMLLIAPVECQEQQAARGVIDRLLAADNALSGVEYINLKQSMKNGGGPACLRLRVPLSDREFAAMHQGVLLNPDRYSALKDWINRYYRDRLSQQDLCDPALIDEVQTALRALEPILDLPGFYES